MKWVYKGKTTKGYPKFKMTGGGARLQRMLAWIMNKIPGVEASYVDDGE